MKAGVIVFPGSNCDHDAWYAINQNLHGQAEFIWHDSTDLGDVDAVILPGGFSYGDYLRCGAIARFSPVMTAVKKFAADGGPVLGICNGFQILVEAGLLPGALLRNRDLQFICREVTLRTETTNSPFTSKLKKGQILHLPIAHGEGRYFADDRTLDELEAEDRVAFRYVDNPNGSAARHRRHSQPRAQCDGHDAASGACLRSAHGFRRRPRHFRIHALRRSRAYQMTITPELIAQHQLTPAEYDKIVSLLGREPSYTELGVFSVMWSEHCSYKSSRIHLKKLPTDGKYVVQGPGENAGIIGIGGGWVVAFKIESHNHPSYIEPFQGAATGVGGILRDIFTMGARPIAVMDSLRFGPLGTPARHNRRILAGVVERHLALRQLLRRAHRRRRMRLRRVLFGQSAGQRVRARRLQRRTRSSTPKPRASAIRSSMSAPRPAATAFTAHPWPVPSSPKNRSRNGPMCRWAIRSSKSCCSKPASKP